MNFLERFNLVAASGSADIRSWKDLLPNTYYDVETAEKVSTRFGDAIRLSLKDPKDGVIFLIYIGRRYLKIFDDGDFEEIKKKKYVLHFEGMFENHAQYNLAEKKP